MNSLGQKINHHKPGFFLLEASFRDFYNSLIIFEHFVKGLFFIASTKRPICLLSYAYSVTPVLDSFS